MTSLVQALDIFADEALIDGQWTGAASGRTLDVLDPATNVPLAAVPACDEFDTKRAIAAAESAFREWRFWSVDRRVAVLDRWYELVLDRIEDLANIITAEQGKPLAEARVEIRYAASFIRWFAQEARRTGGRIVPPPAPDRRILVLKEPVGVCAIITPWNFPATMITRKVAPALAAGCTLILKPSELTPLTALSLARLALSAGVPPGVFNVVTGPPEAIADEFTSNPAIRKLSFTGSTRVGSELMRKCAPQVQRLSLELGGNAPFIVFDDADLDIAIEGALASKFRNAGQACVATNRFIVHDAIHDRFVERLGAAMDRLRVGPGHVDGVTIGPLISRPARDKFEAHLDDALSNGARQLLPRRPDRLAGNFVQPALLVGASPEMRLSREETFGPLAPIFRFGSEVEALALANATPQGLAAYFYTNDLRRAWRVAERLEFGMVGLNSGSVSIETAPFGGMRQSGLGREGGSEGMEEYMETKAVHWGNLG